MRPWTFWVLLRHHPVTSTFDRGLERCTTRYLTVNLMAMSVWLICYFDGCRSEVLLEPALYLVSHMFLYYKWKVRVWVRVRGFVRSGHVRVRVRGFFLFLRVRIIIYFISYNISWPQLTPDDPSWPQMTLWFKWLQLTLVDPRWPFDLNDFSWP